MVRGAGMVDTHQETMAQLDDLAALHRRAVRMQDAILLDRANNPPSVLLVHRSERIRSSLWQLYFITDFGRREGGTLDLPELDRIVC